MASKINPEKEMLFYLKRDLKRLNLVFPLLSFSCSKQTQALVQSYFQDANHFFKKKDFFKSFELTCYVWGLLDALASEKKIKIPEKFRKYFKI